MKNIYNLIRLLTTVTMYLGFTTLAFMVLFLTMGSIFRTFDHPILGDVEISTLLMVALIFFAIPYTQSIDGHVKIGLLADRLPPQIQKYLDIISSLLTFLLATFILVVYYYTAKEYLFENPHFSELLNIPLFPFKYLILFSTFLWGSECMLKFTEDVLSIVNNRVKFVENVSTIVNNQVQKVGEE